MSAARQGYHFCRTHGMSVGKCPQRAAATPPPSEYQHYWRCAHNPSAIENFFEKITICVDGCHTAELRWYDHGVSQLGGESP